MAQRARGRHRRPTSRSRKIGLATAPLVAAVPLAATPAKAATTSTWERLASCESSGNWSINTGNGYYGGVQFSDPTWDEYRNGQFASRADLATKDAQIIVAERLLDARGWSPWPACSSKLGLDAGDAQGSPTTSPARASRGKHRKPATVYVVRQGDTLSAIAGRERVSGGWTALYQLNRKTIGSNPALIRPGQRLLIP